LTIPQSDLDLWSDEAILDPYPLYRELGDTAAAVELTRYGMVALARYADRRPGRGHLTARIRGRGDPRSAGPVTAAAHDALTRPGHPAGCLPPTALL
jgi:hypothetical protein